jgi:phage gp29-like protein
MPWFTEQISRLLGRKPPSPPEPQVLPGRVSSGVSRGLEPEQLAAILKQAEQGDLTKQMELFEEIEEKDAYLASLLQTRKQAVLALDYQVLPADESPQAKEIADEVSHLLRSIDLEEVQLDLLDAIAKGLSVVTIRWGYQRESQRHLPAEFTWVHQRNLLYDLQTGELCLRTAEEPEPIPYGAALVHQYKAKSGSPQRAGLLRSLAWLYLFKNYAIKDWVTFLEKFGQPLVLGKYDPQASKDELNALREAVATIGPEGRGVISKTTEIEFQEAQRYGSAEAYTRFIELIEREMAVAVTGTALSSFDGSGGSNAMALTLDKISQRLTRSDARALWATLRRDLVVPYCYYNFDRADLAPQIEPIIKEPEDLKVAAETIKTLAEAGTPIPVSYVYERFQIPVPQEGEPLLDTMRTGLQQAARQRRLRLASGDELRAASGFINGQIYADGVADAGIGHAYRLLGEQIEGVLQAVAEAEGDYGRLRDLLIQRYAALRPDALAEVIEGALVLSQLAGRLAVQEDA